MNLSLFIAWRYVFSKKKLGVIHIISLISIVGIAIASMALTVVLSVFNGFTDVATDMLKRSNPSLIVEATKGKTINLSDISYTQIAALKGIKKITPVIEESALLSFGEQQAIVKIRTSDSIHNQCFIGEYLAHSLGLQNKYAERGIRLKLTLPKRENSVNALIPDDNFNQESINFAGTFLSRSRLDENYVLIPENTARNLLDYDSNTCTSLFVYPEKASDLPKVQNQIANIVKGKCEVKNLLEQEPIYYRVVKAEKFGVYIILAFIVFIATFNIIGSLALLIMDKRKDIKILCSMGMSRSKVRRIYFYNGLLYSIFGAVSGIFVGTVLCLLQQTFGFIKMGGNGFIIDAFPVKIYAGDLLNVLLLVTLIGIISISIMVRRIKI
ncbi:MAG: FtsX-like permease family protein [Bacteroidales bacterium]|jgi:ABC-type lipoprotein release transport system permease subunit|nr:FtsX-like permease family protein [Bacteroidales bacterium]